MALKITRTPLTDIEAVYNIAKTSQYFDKSVYEGLSSIGDRDATEQYLYGLAGSRDKTASAFNQKDYEYLTSPEDKASYTLYKLSGETNTDLDQYFDAKVQEAIDKETYESLNWFEKTITTLGGVVGNTLNSVYGMVEGLLDISTLAVGGVASGFGGNEEIWKATKEATAWDVTKTKTMQEALNEYTAKYTYMSPYETNKVVNKISKGINDISTGIARIGVGSIPVVGPLLYWGSMAGDFATEAIEANPNINFWALTAYAGIGTTAGYGIEKISGKILGRGTAIDRTLFGGSAGKTGTSIAKRLLGDFLSEGLEESIEEALDTVLYNAIVHAGDPTVARKNYSFKDIIYAGIIGGLTGAILGGARIAATDRYVKTKSGEIVTESYAKKNNIEIEQKFSKIESMNINEAISGLKEFSEKSNVADLIVKYKGKLTEKQIAEQHADEYASAVEKDKKLNKQMVESILTLSKIYNILGEEGFKNATELYNTSFEQNQKTISNYYDILVEKSPKTAIEAKIQASLKKETGIDYQVKVVSDLNALQNRLKNNMKNMYGIDVYFAKLGAIENRPHGLTISENTIVLDADSNLTPQALLDEVVKEELVHTIQFTKDVITPKMLLNIQTAMSNAKAKTNVTPQELDNVYILSKPVTKLSEAQAKAVSQVLLFDKVTVSRLFTTQYRPFSRLYKVLTGIRDKLNLSKELRTQKGKLKFNTLLKSMKMYRDIAAQQLGTSENVEQFIKDYQIDERDAEILRNAYLTNPNVGPINGWSEIVFKQEGLSNEARQILFNEDGTPRTFYKGMNTAGATEFDNTKGDKLRVIKDAIWFTDNRDVASTYATWNNPNARIYSVTFDVKNPFIIDAEGRRFSDIVEGKSTDDVVLEAKQSGYDSVIIKNVVDPGTRGGRATVPATDIVVFSNDNVKIQSEDRNFTKEESKKETPTQLKLEEVEALEKKKESKKIRLPEIKFDKNELIDNEQITLGEYLASQTGNAEYEKPVTATEVVDKLSNTVTLNETQSIAKAIEDVIDLTGVRKLSQQQLTTSTKLEYQALDVRMIADPVFASVTENNFFDVYAALSSNPTARTLLKNAMELRIGADTDGRFSDSFKEKFADWSRQETTSSAQDIALKSSLLRDTKPVTSFVKDLSDKGYSVTIDDSILAEFDERFKSKDKYISELENEIKELEQQVKNNQNNQIEQQALIDEYLDKLNELKTMKNGSIADILDWMINNVDDLNESAKLTSDILNRLLEASRKAEEQGKEVGIYLKGKDADKPFPKVREFFYKWLKKFRSFRLWAMTSSPISWIRNWVGNKGMQILDSATNAVERGIFKAYNANKKTDSWIPTDSMKFNESKAGKKVYDYIDKNYGDYILAEIRGQNKYLDSEDTSDAKKAQFARLIRQKEKAEATGFNKVVQSVKGLSDWGLSTGIFGDDIRIYKSICKNLGNLVASSHGYLLNAIRQEYTTLSKLYEQKGGKLDQKQSARYELLSKALQTKSDVDIINATNKTELKRLITECANKSFDQYFRTSNGFSKWCNNLAQKNPIAAELVSWVVPFPKVAVNILKMAYRYSPGGFLRGLYQQFGLAKNTKLSEQERGTIRAEAIRSYSEATVGTFMLLAGTIAALLGWVDIEDDDYLGPALKMGDIRVGLADLAPSMTTFSVAASFAYGWKEHKEPFKLALNTIYDNTLLSNVENVFRYSTPEQYVENLSISYFSSYIPAIVKLVNKWTTNNAYKDKTGPYWTKLIKTMGSYIPGLSQKVPNKINPYTGQVATSTGSTAGWFNFIASLSPLQLEKTERNALGEEAFRLDTETTGLSGNFTINEKEYTLKDKEKERYSKYRANYISNLYNNIVSGKEKVTIKDDKTGKYKTTTYDKLTDKEKQKVLSNIYSKGTTATKIKYWIDTGNKYIVTDREQYIEYKKLFGSSSNIVYKKSWSLSKFVEGK